MKKKQVQIIELDKNKKGIIFFRGIMMDEMEEITDRLREWWNNDEKPYFLLSHPSLDTDIEFKVVEDEPPSAS